MSQPIDLATLARALGGKRAGNSWSARCPAHDDRTPSLSISSGSDGGVLVHCHAGCEQAQVIAAHRARGLWTSTSRRRATSGHSARWDNNASQMDDQGRKAMALSIWETSVPANGTIVERYLQSRGITLPPPSALRFASCLRHPDGGRWPAMVSLVRNGLTGDQTGVLRTYLAHDGSGKAAVGAQKMMLGPCAGGAVWLSEPSDVLMIGEGVETCLAAIQAIGRPAWAALSTSGMRSLVLPEIVREVIILADGDDSGEAAARHAAQRWTREGRRVRIARPPRGSDFNDLLIADHRKRAEA